jgi:hypothetical protein
MCASFLGKEVVWWSQNTLSSICSTVLYSRECSWCAQCRQSPFTLVTTVGMKHTERITNISLSDGIVFVPLVVIW